MSVSESLICQQCGERVPGDYVVCPYCGYSLVQILRQQLKVKITIFESWGRIYRLLRYPRRTPEWMNQVATNADRKGGIFTLYLVSVAFLTIIGVYFIKLQISVEGHWDDILGLLFFVFLPIIGGIFFWPLLFIIWITLSIFLWMFAKLLGGKGSFKETMSLLGYSLVPLLPGFLLSNFLLLFLMPNPSTSADSDLTTAIQELAGAGATTFAFVFLLPFLVWCIYIAAWGIEKTHRIKIMESAGIAGGVAALFLLAFVLV